MNDSPIGKVYGDLTVIGVGPDLMTYRKNRDAWTRSKRWVVKCRCGVVATKLTNNIVAGRTTSCGQHGHGTYRRSADSGQRLCTVEGCKRLHDSLGFCSLHYWRRRIGKPLTENTRRLKPLKPKPGCSVEGCPRDGISKGMCKTHYVQAKYDRPFTPVAPLKKCSVEGCPRDGVTKKMCKTHYARWERNERV